MRGNVTGLWSNGLTEAASEAVSLRCAYRWTTVMQAEAYFNSGYSLFIFCALLVLVESFMIFLSVSSGV
jgi:hypothetical protein